MKKQDVPQDNEGLLEGKPLDICYALDENGKYITVPSHGWAPKNAALLQAWEVIEGKMAAARQQILQGKLSPIAYYMEKNIMDLKLLASFIELPKWKVRRHLKPSGFRKLNEMTLHRYAAIFHVSVEALTHFSDTGEGQ
jgi:hypothetical protein